MGHEINYGAKFDYFDRYFVTFGVADSAINGPFDITAYFITSAHDLIRSISLKATVL